MSIKLGVSIIVCCYNSEDRIGPTLNHLAKQKIDPKIPLEIILINNASTDNTKQVAQQTWADLNSNFSFRIIDEPNPGLSNAKDRGIQEANYEYLIFCDDDNWLDENYAQIVCDIFSNDDTIGVLGGRGEAVSDVEFPFWFSTYQGSYAVGVQDIETGDVSQRKYVWGAGMAFRRSVYLWLKECGFSLQLDGRKGNNLSAGEDSEICRWFLLAEYKLWYSERLSFKHFIPKDRLQKEYLKNLHIGFAASGEVLYDYDLVLNWDQHPQNTVSNFFKLVFDILRLLISMVRRRSESIKQAKKRIQLLLPVNLIVIDSRVAKIKSATRIAKTNLSQRYK